MEPTLGSPSSPGSARRPPQRSVRSRSARRAQFRRFLGLCMKNLTISHERARSDGRHAAQATPGALCSVSITAARSVQADFEPLHRGGVDLVQTEPTLGSPSSPGSARRPPQRSVRSRSARRAQFGRFPGPCPENSAISHDRLRSDCRHAARATPVALRSVSITVPRSVSTIPGSLTGELGDFTRTSSF